MAQNLYLLGVPILQTLSGPQRLERKTAAVLAYLALEGPTHKYKLAGMLWPDSGETAARNNMRQLLRRLRMMAGEAVLGEDVIELSPAFEVDVKQLSYLETPSLEALQQNLELLAELGYDDIPDFEEWLLSAREELAGLRSRAAKDEAERLERLGNYRQALAYAEVWVRLEPLSEEAYREVIRLHYLLGDRGAALAQFERLKQMLADELSTKPLPETAELIGLVERGTQLKEARPKSKETTLPTAILRPPVLAGREREWALMEEAWEEGRLIALSGEPGSGKTRLAEDFAASKGRSVRHGGRPGDMGIPFATLTRNLRATLARHPELSLTSGHLEPWVWRELAQLLPEIGEGLSAAPTGDKLRLFEAASKLYAYGTTGLGAVITDDLQFLDDSTLEVTAYHQVQHLPRKPGMAQHIVVFRKGELSQAGRRNLELLLDSGMAVLIEVEPLSAGAIGAMLEGMGIEKPAQLVQGLARYTGGNPLFITETLKHLIETHSLDQGLPSRLAPPGKVATLIGRRLQRLSPHALNLARAAAIAATSFNLTLATSVLERPAMELAEAHAELEQAQILRGSAFTHDLVFEATLAATPAAVKQVLHQRTAQHLEGIQANPALIAQHYAEAGQEREAAPYWVKASQQAYMVSLLKEARAFAEQAVRVYQQYPDEQQYQAMLSLVDAVGVHGTFEELSEASRQLLGLARTPAQKVAALATWADTLRLTRRYREALNMAEEGLGLVEPNDLYNHAQFRQVELYSALNLGLFDRARTALDHYKDLAKRSGHFEAQVACLEDEGIYLVALDRHAQAIALFSQTLDKVEEVQQFEWAKARLLSRRAASQLALGFTDQALADAALTQEVVQKYQVSARGNVWPMRTEAYAYLALGQLAKAWERAQATADQDHEEPRISHLMLARVLQALGQQERAVMELNTLLNQAGATLTSRASALMLLSQMGGEAELLDEVETLTTQFPKPELRIGLYLARTGFGPASEALPLIEQALEQATSHKLKPLEAVAWVRKAQALLKLNRSSEAVASIEQALTHPASWLSRAETLYTAYQVYEALNDSKAEQYLGQAQAWIQQTADQLPSDLRRSFLTSALHQKVL